MKMTEMEKKIIGIVRRLEDEKSKEDFAFYGETMLHAQDALKSDYGLGGLDAPFTGVTGKVL